MLRNKTARKGSTQKRNRNYTALTLMPYPKYRNKEKGFATQRASPPDPGVRGKVEGKKNRSTRNKSGHRNNQRTKERWNGEAMLKWQKLVDETVNKYIRRKNM